MLGKIKTMLSNDRGEAYIGEAVKIVIAVVLGAALLIGLSMLFTSVVLPAVEKFVTDMFGKANEVVPSIPAYTPTPPATP